MRKIIETVSTLALWAVWIIGSSLAVSDFFFDAAMAKKITHHLWIVAWSPLIAFGIFAAMLIAVRRSKHDTTKKTIPSEHTVQWTAEELANAQSGKVVDLYFAGAGLACQVIARHEAALVLHTENQTMHVTVQTTDETVITLLHKAF
ncbi:hypothetical protein [Bdellovibrio svalbardensis]|uniref:Uncharacterized protein n=1 Tax=Bdellovibrio svalbardensis TaxID=2972972 RepID=A0ABT6DGG5_9BACT|nr:hypothetical protein [Bdellovibrio svalbardensis]MDG0815948.1 hypothetical protein [Bdellovibrio svalbardensis]